MAGFAATGLLSHALERAAIVDPARPALVCGDESIDYGGLIDRVSRLAAALGDQGIEPGDRVAVHLAKGIDAFVAMHAAQRAGAIAVPVNPAAPPDVVTSIVAEVAATAMVVDDRSIRRLAPEATPEIVVGTVPESVETPARVLTWNDVAAHQPGPIVDRAPSDPAYMITTSGSTGRPKAIVHSHASGLAYATLAAECYGLTNDDVMGNVAPFHFDQSTFELYSSMVAGASVVLIPEVLLRFPANLSALVAETAMTTWYSVPTILQQLAERGAMDEHDLSSLRWVLFGGEVFPAAVLRRLMEALPNARFSNVYGPAEVNQCMFHHLDGPPADGASISIGNAWDDTDVVLLDGDDLLVGAGTGEAYVRSTTMMLGYWDQPELTARSIVDAPHPDVAGRWYRTGDLIERTDDGLLHFVGRIDRQVKIRGNRVELEAVEAAIAGLDGVTGCAAIVSGDGADKTLTLVAESADEDTKALARHARAVLPPYALPDTIIIVDSLPRTGSGKIDANAAAALCALQ